MTDDKCPVCQGRYGGKIWFPAQTPDDIDTWVNCVCHFEKRRSLFLDALPKNGTPLPSDSPLLQEFLKTKPLGRSIYFSGNDTLCWGLINGALRELYFEGMQIYHCNPEQLAKRFVHRDDPEESGDAPAMQVYKADLFIADLCDCPSSIKYNQILHMTQQNRVKLGLVTWAVRELDSEEMFNKVYYPEIRNLLQTFDQVHITQKSSKISLKQTPTSKSSVSVPLPPVPIQQPIIRDIPLDDSMDSSIPELDPDPPEDELDEDRPLTPFERKSRMQKANPKASHTPKTKKGTK